MNIDICVCARCAPSGLDRPEVAANAGVTLVSVASVDRLLAVLHLAARWQGPLSFALYARTAEEDSAFASFVSHRLGKSCAIPCCHLPRRSLRASRF